MSLTLWLSNLYVRTVHDGWARSLDEFLLFI